MNYYLWTAEIRANEVLCQAVQTDSKVLLKQKSHFVSGLIW